MINLKGKNVFLTGATGGIGSEFLKQLTFEKCNIFPTYTFLHDFRNENHIYEAVMDCKKEFDHIDILINCAGIFTGNFNDMFNINVKAPYIFMEEFKKDMIERKWGRIVNICSSSAYKGVADTPLYCASKHALLGLSRSFYEDLKKHNIRVFSVSPGTVQTKMGRLIKGDWNTFINPKELVKYIINIIKYDNELIIEEIKINRFRR